MSPTLKSPALQGFLNVTFKRQSSRLEARLLVRQSSIRGACARDGFPTIGQDSASQSGLEDRWEQRGKKRADRQAEREIIRGLGKVDASRGIARNHQSTEVSNPVRHLETWRKQLERAKGIEPSSVAWEATALPLSYARLAWGEFRRVQVSGAMRRRDEGRLPGPRFLPQCYQTVRRNQKLPLKFTNKVASRALR